ncbi:hypothetical protein COLO4_20112 [Corchorus olitorius]|uniref:GH18 domain-containing protein n=1 Tax=Corchorus olitorius TaxID=93759 RepID=A0A1R3J1K5_9ROSI|nr:hypothetical protein COLO4_20112 [Corchorus olitorius]
MDGSMGYKTIRSYIRDYGFGISSVYNATYVVNLFTSTTIFINFDGIETVKAKVAYVKEKGLAGYNAFQLSNDDNWALSQAAQDGDKDHQKNKHQLLLKIILPVSVVFILVAAALVYYLRQRKSKQEEEAVLRIIPSPRTNTSAAENFGSDAPQLQVFKFAYIKAATNNFASDNKLGEGGFGPVYKVLYVRTTS